jgi:predicted alpha/beta superfamily hydrolase
MKNICLFLLSIIIASASFAQTDNKIVIGKVDSVYSNILKEQRKIWVYVPNMNSGQQNSKQRFPVLYLLDGDAHFNSVVGMIQQLSQVNGNTIFPEMIVVAIPNTDRTRDLTPTHVDSDPPMMDSSGSKNSGGGENFAAFLEKELIRHVDSAYLTEPFKVLVGHSFGGLTVMNILTNHTKLFNAYIAIDPSMWYDKESFLKTTQQKLATQKYDGRILFVGVANTMTEGMSLKQMNKDTSVSTRHIRSIFAMDKFIKSNSKNGLKYASKYYGDDDHGSVPFITEYDGLRFIFSWYRFKTAPGDYMSPGTELVQKMKKHYQNVSKEMGYKVSPPESTINGLGYYALSQKHYDKAIAFFEMNVENYPESGNVYDSYADGLAAKKDTAGAIANYEKAWAITKNEDTKHKLDQLQGKSTFTISPKDLAKYVSVFEFEGVDVVATTSMRGDELWVSAPGQGEFQLQPLSLNTFTVIGAPGYTLKFEMDGDKPVGLTAIQPNGTYKAHVKK